MLFTARLYRLLLLLAHRQTHEVLVNGDLLSCFLGYYLESGSKRENSTELSVRTVGERKAVDSTLCISRCSCPGHFNSVLANVDSGVGHSRLGTTLPSPPKICTRASGTPFALDNFHMSSGRAAGEISHRSSSWPTPSASRESLSMWSSPDDSGSTHCSGDGLRSSSWPFASASR